MRRIAAILAAPIAALSLAQFCWADDTHPTDFASVQWQQATGGDIHIFDPYIGRFRSKTFHDEERDKEFHYVIEYRWFDPGQTIVKFSVAAVVPADDTETSYGEGFYGYDPFRGRLYTYAFFPSGTSGFGGVSQFDRETHRRVTRARSRGEDGTTTEVRDEFELIDANSWRNTTFISRDGSEWQRVHEGIYTRIEADES